MSQGTQGLHALSICMPEDPLQGRRADGPSSLGWLPFPLPQAPSPAAALPVLLLPMVLISALPPLVSTLCTCTAAMSFMS